MPVTGVAQVKANYKRTFKDITEKKAPQFIAAVMSIGENHSKELAPLEYGTLVNSITNDITIKESRVTGVLAYNTLYAVILENKPGWKPRPPDMKAGPAWNPRAEPHFLRKGFEDPESRADIKRAEDIFKI